MWDIELKLPTSLLYSAVLRFKIRSTTDFWKRVSNKRQSIFLFYFNFFPDFVNSTSARQGCVVCANLYDAVL